MKKTLTLVLSLALILSLFTGFAAAEEETRVLTIGSNLGISEQFLHYDVFQKVFDELNMTIEITQYNDDSFTAMLSGGDLPDIVMTSTKLQNIIGNGLALNIEPYLEEYAPNLLGDTYSAALQYTKTMSEDGGVYIICPTVGVHNPDGGTSLSSRGYIVNWEYYKELGCPEINNDEDFLNVLLQMWENHPTTEEGDVTYLFGVEKGFTDMGGYRACFTSEVSLDPWTPYLYKNNIFTNDLVNGYTDVEHSHYWADMEFYNKIYRAGGFDIDCFTMSSDEYYSKVDKKQYMGLYYDTDDTYVSVPSSGTNWYANLILLTGQAPAYYTFISANSKNYDLALQFYNYIYDLDFAREWYSGVQGKDWDYDENGVPTLTDEALAAIASEEDSYWKGGEDCNGYHYRHWMLSGYNPGVLHSDGYPLDLTLNDSARVAVQTDIQRDIAETYGVEHWSDAYNAVDTQKDFRNSAEGLAAGLADMPMDMQRILESCNDVLYSAMPMLIMAESDEEFAQIQEETLAEISALGEAKAWEWYQTEWEQAKPLYNELLIEALKANNIEPYEGLE